MKYAIIWAEHALKKFNRLPVIVRRAIAKRIDAAAENPFHFFTKLVGRQEYRLRIGNYRVIADIVNDKVLILVVDVGHRKNVYD
jgi:mRNA interferase RelE/StbE